MAGARDDGSPEARSTPEGGVAAEVRHDTRIGDQDLTDWSTPVGRGAARSAQRASSRLGPHGALALILGLGIVLAFVLAFLAARVYDAVTESDGVAGLDVPLLHAAMGLRSPALDGIAAAVAVGFGPIGMPVIAVLACVLLAVRRRSITPVILVVAAGLGSLLMTVAGKDIIDRHRPSLADAIPPFEYSPSFPSGHTLNATVILGVLAYLLVLRQRSAGARVITVAAALVVSLVVGLTRILLGAHWFTDVLAAWLLGAAWLALVITAHRLYLTTRRRGAVEAVSQDADRR
ncbi:phosphatase PAP2 family protein [uncultured Amnibacterium sp.]|uniref:phosphatase PAP2 family protein n=1 Tax=uncultured Amnibacterium sp. TaxID=1631851 RepID=UPI0035CA6067